MTKTKQELIKFVQDNKQILDSLSNGSNAIFNHATSIDPTCNNYGDVQKDIVLCIRGYQILFKELTGL